MDGHHSSHSHRPSLFTVDLTYHSAQAVSVTCSDERARGTPPVGSCHLCGRDCVDQCVVCGGVVSGARAGGWHVGGSVRTSMWRIENCPQLTIVWLWERHATAFSFSFLDGAPPPAGGYTHNTINKSLWAMYVHLPIISVSGSLPTTRFQPPKPLSEVSKFELFELLELLTTKTWDFINADGRSWR